jgi:hypothetical protein
VVELEFEIAAESRRSIVEEAAPGRSMATATQLMPSPTAGHLKSASAFSPYTDSPSSPAPFAHAFSNRCGTPSVVTTTCVCLRVANGVAQVFQHL